MDRINELRDSINEMNLMLDIAEKKSIIKNKINKITNIQKSNNILTIMELYDIFSPLVREKHIIQKIIDMKIDMEICHFKKKLDKLSKKLQ